MLIGDKDYFAIEYDLIDVNSLMGNIVLYIKGLKIGYYEEETYLNATFVNLKRAIKERVKFEELKKLGNKSLEDRLIKSNSEDYDCTILTLGDVFDDFYIRLFFTDETNFKIILKLSEEPFYQYEHIKNCLYSWELDSRIVLSLISEFENRIIKDELV